MLFVTELFMESHSSLAPLIDQLKGYYGNILRIGVLKAWKLSLRSV